MGSKWGKFVAHTGILRDDGNTPRLLRSRYTDFMPQMSGTKQRAWCRPLLLGQVLASPLLPNSGHPIRNDRLLSADVRALGGKMGRASCQKALPCGILERGVRECGRIYAAEIVRNSANGYAICGTMELPKTYAATSR